MSRPLTIGDVRLIVADIPVSRPHHMSFTTLTAVNFVFVRIETHEGLVGWGEAACLGGSTWSEESAESIAAGRSAPEDDHADPIREMHPTEAEDDPRPRDRHRRGHEPDQPPGMGHR